MPEPAPSRAFFDPAEVAWQMEQSKRMQREAVDLHIRCDRALRKLADVVERSRRLQGIGIEGEAETETGRG